MPVASIGNALTRDVNRATGSRAQGPEGRRKRSKSIVFEDTAADILFQSDNPDAPLPPTTTPAVEPVIQQDIEFRRRQGLRKTLLTGPGGVASGPVQKQTLLGS